MGRDIRGETTMNNSLFNLVLRWAFLAMGVALAAKIVPGIHCADGATLLVVVVLLSLFNAFLKPLLVLFTLPLVILSAGFGLWLINAFLLWATSRMVEGFYVEGLWAALLGSMIISLTNMAFSTLVGPNKVKVRRAPPPSAPPPPRPTPPPGKGDVIDV
ncbi:MAG: phage holin family protein [Opitutaceae bacterium]|nr:phage holin family protein [Opitutaceae bacterium]